MDSSEATSAHDSPPPPAADSALEDRARLAALHAKINALLPPIYQNCYDAVKPVSMGSTGLVHGADGKVAWDQMWTSFCDLAMAGGPPHRGTLLEAPAAEEVYADQPAYHAVVEEIARGIWLVTELGVMPHAGPGWVGIRCEHEAMARWLVRAIVVENISARREREYIFVPAGPRFHLEKEIKNVVTAVAKTHHYWAFHLPANQGADSVLSAEDTRPGIECLHPALPAEARAAPDLYQAAVRAIETGIQQATGLSCVASVNLGWLGIQCTDADMAVWLMRAAMALGLLVRREESIVFVPASPKFVVENHCAMIVEAFAEAFALWRIHLALET